MHTNFVLIQNKLALKIDSWWFHFCGGSSETKMYFMFFAHIIRHLFKTLQAYCIPFYSGFLKLGLTQILKGQKKVGLQLVRILIGIRNPKAKPLEIWTNGCHFVENHLKSRQKCTNFECSGFGKVHFQIVRTIAIAKAIARPFKTGPFEICSSKKLFSNCWN